MKAIEMETTIDPEGKLPDAFQEAFGRKARVIVLYQEESQFDNSANLMECVGKVNAFRDIDDPLSYQRKLREEWNME